MYNKKVFVLMNEFESEEATEQLFPNITKSILEIKNHFLEIEVYTIADQSLSPRLLDWCIENNISMRVCPIKVRLPEAAWETEYKWWSRKSYALTMNKIISRIDDFNIQALFELATPKGVPLTSICPTSSRFQRNINNKFYPNAGSTSEVCKHIKKMNIIAYDVSTIASRNDLTIIEASMSGRSFLKTRMKPPKTTWRVSSTNIIRGHMEHLKTTTHFKPDHSNLVESIINFNGNGFSDYSIAKFRFFSIRLLSKIGFGYSPSDLFNQLNLNPNNSRIANIENQYRGQKAMFSGDDIVDLCLESFDMVIRGRLIKDIYYSADQHTVDIRNKIIKVLARSSEAYESWAPEVNEYTFRAPSDGVLTELSAVVKLKKKYILESKPETLIDLTDDVLSKIKVYDKSIII